MKMIELNNKEKNLLKDIMTDKFSNGAFAGMILNICESKATSGITYTVERIIKNALDVRLKCLELAGLQEDGKTETVKEACKSGKITDGDRVEVDLGL